MFEVLDRVDLEVAEEALYHIGLRVYERRYFPEWRHWLPLRTSGVLNPRSLEVASEVIGEIECRTMASLGAMEDDEVGPYDQAIRLIVEARRKKERPGLGREVGERLLEELRRDYGDLSRRVA